MELRQSAGTARWVAALLVVAGAAGCAVAPAPPTADSMCPPCPICPTPVVSPPSAPAAKPLRPARWEDLPGWRQDDLSAAWGAFLQSCVALEKQANWAAVCADAQQLKSPDAGRVREFFEARFLPHQVVNPDETRDGLVTGYYEPLVKGSRKRSRSYRYPLYGVPDDLLVVDLGELYPEIRHLRLRGRIDGRKVVPYYSRSELGRREAQLAGRVLFWAADPIELFFLQVQGSGRIELEDGARARVGYADQNGHPYLSIGRWLVEKGELDLDQASMQGIQAWAKANPRRLDELLDANPSFVFFRELPNDNRGPIGALGVPLTEGRSLAVDPRTVLLGAPVFLATTWPLSTRPLNRLMFAQDTGGAIKGAVRGDFYWGSGPEAGALAGRMRQKGQMWALLPRSGVGN